MYRGNRRGRLCSIIILYPVVGSPHHPPAQSPVVWSGSDGKEVSFYLRARVFSKSRRELEKDPVS